MKKVKRIKHYNYVEKVSSETTTVQGCALSVYELYQKMIVGSIDAAGYVHPIEYDESPNIDSPDPLNKFGFDVGEIEEQISVQSEIAQNEVKKRGAKAEEKPAPQPLTKEPQTTE